MASVSQISSEQTSFPKDGYGQKLPASARRLLADLHLDDLHLDDLRCGDLRCDDLGSADPSVRTGERRGSLLFPDTYAGPEDPAVQLRRADFAGRDAPTG